MTYGPLAGKKTTYVINTQPELSQVLQSTETNLKDNKETTTYYYYGNGLNAQDNGKDYFVYHFNNVGSTMAVTDSKGDIVETYNYTPYGELITGEYREDIPFLYNGQYGVTTDSNGLYYMRARYYNADIKRFINQDVLLGVLERVSSLNRYAYVEGNPVSYLDPFGLEPIDTTIIHDILSVFGTFVSLLSICLPTNPLVAGLSFVINSADIILYIHDLSEAKKQNNILDMVGAACNIAKDIISIVNTLIGFNSEVFFEKISNFTGWGRVCGFIKQTNEKIEYAKHLMNIADNSIFVEGIAGLILDMIDS